MLAGARISREVDGVDGVGRGGQTRRMAAPRFGSVNLVLADVSAAAAFLDELGVELSPGYGDWDAHHRSFAAAAPDGDTDLDSASFANWWGGVPAETAPGVVVNLRIDGRDEVDVIHRRALELGAEELKAPWDAFWGARYSVVLAPGPLYLGFMSEPEPDRRTPGPEISDFA